MVFCLARRCFVALAVLSLEPTLAARSTAPIPRWYNGTLSIPQGSPLVVSVDLIGGRVFVKDSGLTIRQARVSVAFDHRTRAVRIRFTEVFGDCSLSGYTDTLTGSLNPKTGRLEGRYRSEDGPRPFGGTFRLRAAPAVAGPVRCQVPTDRPTAEGWLGRA